MQPGYEYAPPDTPLHILHEDAHLIAVNKPSGLLTVPGKGPALRDCLIERLREMYPEILLVHRLDRDTSGVIVFALTRHAQRHLSLQFERRHAKKSYLAHLTGQLTPESGTVDLPLTADWENRPRQMVCHDRGRSAQTDWHVLRHEGDTTQVRLIPHTGRSHQLRVHMQVLGHPVLGDPLYAGTAAAAHPRLMLHSEELSLRCPGTGAEMTFRADSEF
ncbi:RluA family pseudouridine synthase [Pontibaca salina]|uniref:Pseudouridine synthase n=1 Tax=Pontibaca salina TaxID=2795731 RepID=A0A934HSW5_9RHOB|nr:RluA family pseudouridine synthase [Pontibaca salina]MBI6630110.1 RluA family pseudouridine synthase [Pontibaca salina]